MKIKKIIKRTVTIVLALAVFLTLIVFGVNGYVILRSQRNILTLEKAKDLTDVDCVLVLGCQVKPDGVPSHMLEDRLRKSVELFHAGVAPKLLMSGDHGEKYYNEVGAMKQYAVNAGIKASDVFMDHAGFSTYESMYRAKEVFGAKKIIIVTQKYHLYRAIYIANSLGLEAYGVACDYRSYSGQFYRDVREILARNKDFLTSIFKPMPTYLGETIPVGGDGNITNDSEDIY